MKHIVIGPLQPLMFVYVVDQLAIGWSWNVHPNCAWHRRIVLSKMWRWFSKCSWCSWDAVVSSSWIICCSSKASTSTVILLGCPEPLFHYAPSSLSLLVIVGALNPWWYRATILCLVNVDNTIIFPLVTRDYKVSII